MRIHVSRYSFIDSLNFFNIALAKLLSMFSLEGNYKGYYPYDFNTPENLNYMGKLLDLKYYWPDKFKCKEREKLIEWYTYKLSENDIFNNREELLTAKKR